MLKVCQRYAKSIAKVCHKYAKSIPKVCKNNKTEKQRKMQQKNKKRKQNTKNGRRKNNTNVNKTTKMGYWQRKAERKRNTTEKHI